MKKHFFPNKNELAIELCSHLVAHIFDAIEEHGSAHILLSGGSTPFDVYTLLANQKMEWHKVIIGLVDERYVAEDDAHSNYGAIKKVFQPALKQGAQLLPMVLEPMDKAKNLTLVSKSYAPFFERIDISFLGMGTDGHTASLFPNDEASERDLNKNVSSILYTFAPSHPIQRITCSAGMLRQSNNTIIMFTGEEKQKVFEIANSAKLPIHRLTIGMDQVYLFTC